MTHRNLVPSSCRVTPLRIYVLLLRNGLSRTSQSSKLKRGSVEVLKMMWSCWIKIGGSAGRYGEQFNTALPPSNTTNSGGLSVRTFSARVRWRAGIEIGWIGFMNPRIFQIQTHSSVAASCSYGTMQALWRCTGWGLVLHSPFSPFFPLWLARKSIMCTLQVASMHS